MSNDESASYLEYNYQERSRDARGRKREQKRVRAVYGPERAQLMEIDDSIDAFVPSYAAKLDPLHHERQWVINSVGDFYANDLISDVTHLVKGGKEANVYCCQANEATGFELAAAKLYRPRMLRHLRNDAVYKAGRILKSEEGKLLKGRREKLALRKKTKFGKQVDIMWWIGNEYRTQQLLFDKGVDVPRPLAHSGTAILMEYIGDTGQPAPTLNNVVLEHEAADAMYHRILYNISMMLDNHLIHGDLSAYNILYWSGQATIIDFPQMVDARLNPHAFRLLLRDVTRVSDYFRQYGFDTDPQQLTVDLWEPYMGRAY